jgi:hypothetical protein
LVVACVSPAASAPCVFSGGFDAAYAAEFKERFEATFARTRALKDGDRNARGAERLRRACDLTAAQAARAFPTTCPEKPQAVHPLIEEFRAPAFLRNGSAMVRLGEVFVEVSLG